MRRPSSLLTGGLLLLQAQGIAGITVELSEVQQITDDTIYGAYDSSRQNFDQDPFNGVDPMDADCPNSGKCLGLLTRDGSLELDSRFGCTEPSGTSSSDSNSRSLNYCWVRYGLSSSSSDTQTISSVRVALHPDSTNTLTIRVDGVNVVGAWEGIAGSSELQEITGLEGLETDDFFIYGAFGAGDYLGILEVEINVEVDEVPVVGTSANTRTTISATATTDAASVMNTLDGDATDSSSWTCASGEVCEITYDLQAVESLEQLRIAFAESSDDGGELTFMTAGESGEFSTAREGVEAGGRLVGSDGLQTFGGIRALARYVKIEVVPPTGGSIVINEVEFRVGDDAPTRPVSERAWLKPTGDLPLAIEYGSDFKLNYDARAAEDGGCDSPAQFEGCQSFYMKDGDLDSRWSCGPLATGNRIFFSEDCEMGLDLNQFRYVRQVQIAFHLGDEQHNEFSIEALTAQGWMTVVGSAISSGDTTDYQTFNVGVHASALTILPKFQEYNQWFSIKEIIVLEKRKNAFIAGAVPVFEVDEDFAEEAAQDEVPTRFRFDMPSQDDSIQFTGPSSIRTALRMRFPAGREFVFEVSYDSDIPAETFTSAGGENEWETFTFSEAASAGSRFTITAVSGPTFENKPDYPTLRVVDFQVVGELSTNDAGYFRMVSTTMTAWGGTPGIIGKGMSEQQQIMTAICETKGATFDGTDCVGDLDDSTVFIDLVLGEYYLDGPVFMKSGVTISGVLDTESNGYTEFVLYEGDNIRASGEDAIIVFDNVTGAEIENISMVRLEDATGDIVPGTVGNLCVAVRDSRALVFSEIGPRACRSGAATFVDSSNISAFLFWEAYAQETGNYMELTRVNGFTLAAFPDMGGILIDSCNSVVWEGAGPLNSELPNPRLSAPVGGDQTANVVITGDSSGIVFQSCDVGPGAEPRILIESTQPLTLEDIWEYEEAVSGDCIVEVPTGTTDDLIVQVDTEQTLSKSGTCWILD